MNHIYLYTCYLMRMCRDRIGRICVRAGLICKCSILLSACCILLSGCSAGDSGLYRVSTGESIESDADGGTETETASGVDSDAGTDIASGSGSYAGTGAADGSSQQEDEPSGSAQTVAEPDIADTVIYVHICGAVMKPGVYEMTPGDRIFNAVESAGGFAEDASTDYVNLAQEIADGMKITIPTVAEAEAMAETSPEAVSTPLEYAGTATATATTAAAASDGSAGASASGASDGRININTADASALTSITGIGPARAEAIIAYREQNGAFGSIEDIRNVSGIGDSTFNKLKDEITVQ